VHDVHWKNELFTALCERALWWPARSTLLIADLHLGKAASFRHHGVPVPEAPTDADLARLASLIARFSPRRLVILGDMLHARTGRAPETMRAFAEWREQHAALDILLIRGNHDASSGDPPTEWNIRVAPEPHTDDSADTIAFAHDPARVATSTPFMCGHIHPGVVLGNAARTIRCPAFWFNHRFAMLPAFGSFTGHVAISPRVGDTVLAVGPDAVVNLTPPRPPVMTPCATAATAVSRS
jgi:DNA ligase-associated metallophosphoesterase